MFRGFDVLIDAGNGAEHTASAARATLRMPHRSGDSAKVTESRASIGITRWTQSDAAEEPCSGQWKKDGVSE